MRTKTMSVMAVFWLATALCNCGADEESGSAYVGVKSSGLSIEAIDHIVITVSGQNIDPPIVVPVPGDPVNGWSCLIPNIPAGDGRMFLAQAYDATDVVIYEGSATDVSIIDGETVQVIIFLQQVNPPDSFENAVPRFDSLVLSASQVAPGHTVDIVATASDPDGDPLVYAWSATGGSFSDEASPSTVWTAPETEGTYTLSVSATDLEDAVAAISFEIDVRIHYGKGSAEVILDINSWPEVQGLVPDPARIDVGETTQLELTTTDPDGDPLTYVWTATCTGTFSDTAAEDPSFTLDADNGGADCTLTAEISDGRGGSNTASISIATGPAPEIEETIPENFSDGFEEPTIEDYWGTLTQQNGVLELSAEQAHSGNQSIKLLKNSSAGQCEVHLSHSMDGLHKGRVSAWFYDAHPGEQTLYCYLVISNSEAAFPNGGNGYGVGIQDWVSANYIPNTLATVPRTFGWHLLEIVVDDDSMDALVDGVLVDTLNGDLYFDGIEIILSGPAWRPNAEYYYDDFSVEIF